MTNYDLQEKQFQISDPIESYFECITTCDVRDGKCISRCVEILKHSDRLIFYLFSRLVISVGITFN